VKCPKCGDKDAEQVKLFTSTSYLCPNQTCTFFDMDRAVELVASAFGADDEWQLPDDEVNYYLPGEIGLTD
jgi:hypothetical protein